MKLNKQGRSAGPRRRTAYALLSWAQRRSCGRGTWFGLAHSSFAALRMTWPPCRSWWWKCIIVSSCL